MTCSNIRTVESLRDAPTRSLFTACLVVFGAACFRRCLYLMLLLVVVALRKSRLHCTLTALFLEVTCFGHWPRGQQWPNRPSLEIISLSSGTLETAPHKSFMVFFDEFVEDSAVHFCAPSACCSCPDCPRAPHSAHQPDNKPEAILLRKREFHHHD